MNDYNPKNISTRNYQWDDLLSSFEKGIYKDNQYLVLDNWKRNYEKAIHQKGLVFDQPDLSNLRGNPLSIKIKNGIKSFLNLFLRIRNIVFSTVNPKFQPRLYKYSNFQGGNLQFDPYLLWQIENMPRLKDLMEYCEVAGVLPLKPKISMILAIQEGDFSAIEKSVVSLMQQVYDNWELRLSLSNSCSIELRKNLETFEQIEPRIKLDVQNHSSEFNQLLNNGLKNSKGDFIGFLFEGDQLSPDALYQNVLAINQSNDIDLIYSDEDRINNDGEHFSPQFKPDWSPDTFITSNYLGNLLLIRGSLVYQAGFLRDDLVSLVLFDYFSRITKLTNKIRHISKVLYHRTNNQTFTSRLCLENEISREKYQSVINNSLKTGNEIAELEKSTQFPDQVIINYQPASRDLVSIIIPTKNQGKILEKCLLSIFSQTSYPNYEVVLVDNGTTEEYALNVIQSFSSQYPDQFQSYKKPCPFNFSGLINYGVQCSKGKFLLLLNNDTEVIDPRWIDSMVSQAHRSSIGCVGVQLLYPNGSIQHAGVEVRCRLMGDGNIVGPNHILHQRLPEDPIDSGRIHRVHNYSAVTAACMMVRRSVFDQVNGFDEGFAVSYNDVDFCLRVQSLGLFNIYLPHVRLIHYESLTRKHPLENESSANQYRHELVKFARSCKKNGLKDSHWSPHLFPSNCQPSLLTDSIKTRSQYYPTPLAQ